MLRYSCGAVAAAVLLHLPAAAIAADPVHPKDLAQQLDASLGPYYGPKEPGATIIVVKDGKTVFRKGYGLADLSKGTPLTPDMTMRIGSVTKQFTATAILMLADEGKLALGDDVTKYLPDYPTHGARITIDNLLTHTSGIVNFTSKPAYVENMAKDMTLAQMIDGFSQDPLEFSPGSAWRYSNSNYLLLGAIVERVSGMPYAKFVEQRIFVPLGMNNTAYEGHERKPNPHAVGYAPGQNGFSVAPLLSMTQPFAAGALVSTVDDLALWDAAVSSGKLLKAESWQRAFTPAALSSGGKAAYGYGWELGKLRGYDKVGHSGGINGFVSYVLRLPSEHVYVAVLANTMGGMINPAVVASKAAAIVVGKPYPDFKAITLEPSKIDAFAGVYTAGPNAKRTFQRVDDTLVVQRTGGPRVKLSPLSENGFFIPDGLGWYEFKPGANGAMTVITHTEDQDTSDQRTGPVIQRVAVKINAADFDKRAGRYQFPGGFVLELSRSGDRYFAQGSGQPKLEVIPISELVFVSDQVGAELRFDDPAHPDQAVLVQGGQRHAGTLVK